MIHFSKKWVYIGKSCVPEKRVYFVWIVMYILKCMHGWLFPKMYAWMIISCPQLLKDFTHDESNVWECGSMHVCPPVCICACMYVCALLCVHWNYETASTLIYQYLSYCRSHVVIKLYVQTKVSSEVVKRMINKCIFMHFWCTFFMWSTFSFFHMVISIFIFLPNSLLSCNMFPSYWTTFLGLYCNFQFKQLFFFIYLFLLLFYFNFYHYYFF